MKFSVWDYSQIKIAQFNASHPDLALDPTDIFIFTWFKNFATRTRSKNSIRTKELGPDNSVHTKKVSANNHASSKKDGSATKGMWTKTIDGVDYFNVRYEAIIKDFPILSFSSVKSIQRRFDKYVEAGIFEKTIVHAGKKGNFTYFAFTDLFWSFEYDNDNPEHKQISADNSIQTKEINANNSVQTQEVSADNSVQTKKIGADNFVQTKNVGTDNPVHTVIYNPTASLNNHATTSFEPTKNQNGAAEEEVFHKILTTLFGYDPCFSPNPYPALVHNFKACNLEKTYLEEYLRWIFKELKPKCKNPDNFVSYFYKSFTQAACVSKFAHNKNLALQRMADKKARQIACPVCDRIHDKNDFFCPNDDCGLPKDYLDSPADIEKQRSLYHLKQNAPEKYRDYRNQLDELLKKYPMSVQIMNKAKKIEFNNLLSQLESEFLNIQSA